MEKEKTAQELAEQITFKYLALDRIEKEAKEKKEALKEELTALCNAVYQEKFIKDKWELPASNAVIKLALNPHKVVDSRTNNPLTPSERQAIAITLDDNYCTIDLNVKEIQASVEHDKSLKNAMKIAKRSHNQSVVGFLLVFLEYC